MEVGGGENGNKQHPTYAECRQDDDDDEDENENEHEDETEVGTDVWSNQKVQKLGVCAAAAKNLYTNYL